MKTMAEVTAMVTVTVKMQNRLRLEDIIESELDDEPTATDEHNA